MELQFTKKQRSPEMRQFECMIVDATKNGIHIMMDFCITYVIL
jgi:hypothetical protein